MCVRVRARVAQRWPIIIMHAVEVSVFSGAVIVREPGGVIPRGKHKRARIHTILCTRVRSAVQSCRTQCAHAFIVHAPPLHCGDASCAAGFYVCYNKTVLQMRVGEIRARV